MKRGEGSKLKHDIYIVKKAINGDISAFEETSCNAFLSISQLKNPDFFSTWLFRILIRECYRLLKRRNQVIPYEESELLKKLDSKQGIEIDSFYLSEALSKLHSFYQTAILLFYYHDLSIQEILEIMEKPLGTVKTYLRRAKKKLKTDLERSYKINEKIT